MRRGGGSGRGGRPMHNTNPRPLMSMGSLVASQNQLGLQDIDLELELLKRKREIIEQQQHMLRNEYSGEDSFSQISRLYPESRGFYGEGSGAGKKRPNVWEHEGNAPKRFNNANTVPPRKTFTPQSQFRSQYSSYPPRSQQSYRGRRPTGTKKKTDFNPSKVTKPSASAHPPNKLNTYAPADRKKLVTSAVKASAVAKESLVLRADREPSNQLAGRLGLALGYIIKQIKTQFPQYEDMFKNPREIKRTVRERLRVALMGKYVGSLEEILDIYRQVYPPETDREIIMKVVEAESSSGFIPIESDDPHEFYMKNLGFLMTRKLEEMFTHLCDHYRVEYGIIKPQQKEKKGVPEENNTAAVETDKEPIKEENPETATENDENTSKTDQSNETKDVQEPKKDKNKKKQEKAKQDLQFEKYISTKEYQELDRLMTAKLPLMLKKFIPHILRAMKLDGNYRKSVSQLRAETNKKLNLDESQSKPIDVDEEPASEQEQPDKERDSKELKTPKPAFFQYAPLPYFVKILGRPSLPKRKAMQEFFEKFKPKSIKKHRTVHNLLFVGFADKESYESILAADGTQIGRFTLSVKMSDRSNQEKPAKDSKNNDAVKLINSELEEQITDLLDSIKKSEGLLDDTKDKKQEDNDVIEVPDDNVKQETDQENENNDKTENIEKDCDPNDDTQKDTIDKVSPDDTLEIGEKNSETEKLQTKGNTESENSNQKNTSEIVNSDTSDQTNSQKTVTNGENGGTIAAIQNSELEKVAETQNTQNEVPQKTPEVEAEEKDTVTELKSAVNDVKTPTRTSARLANTPSTIRTRRTSKLANDNP